MKKTALALFIGSVISSSVLANTSSNDYVFNYTNPQGLYSPIDLTQAFTAANAFSLESGSLTFRIRNSKVFGTMLGVADPKVPDKYLSFYVMGDTKTNRDTIGIEIRNNRSFLISNDNLKITVPTTQDEFKNITYTFDKNRGEISIYVNGEKLKTHNASKFFADLSGLSSASLGETRRPNKTRMQFNGDIFYADFDKKVLTADEVANKHTELSRLQDYYNERKAAFGSIKTAGESLFVGSQDDGQARNYRIPSLFTTKNGVVIAAIDKRNQHHLDWGNIDTAIRRSLDGGKTWQDDQVILDLASQPYGNKNAAFLIDPLMVQDKNSGRIFMIVDMFPEMQGLFNFPNHGEGTGYKNIGGKQYRLLTDDNNNHYTVRENGVVYNEQNQPTDYRVIVEGTQSRAYQDVGDLYQGDQRLGNIFLNTKEQDDHGAAPLTAKRTSYLWMTHSDDDGATWSTPVDLTSQVKEDWMQFMGTGPGNGIQLKNGNLLMPVYYTNNVGGLNSQSPAVIISTDGGQTWTRGESPIDRWEYDNDGTRELNAGHKQMTESQVIELDNGDIKMFSRNLKSNKVVISTSKDGGYTWQKNEYVDDILLEPYSQLSVIKYSKRIDGKEVVIFANPHSATRDRVNGRVWLGEVQEDGSIKWKYSTTITTGSYAYNSLTELPNGDIGLLYEESASNIKYVSLNLQELVWNGNKIYRDSRNPENKEFSLHSLTEEVFYKIGDGEMIKVGRGSNPANLIVREGTATLNQEADDNGLKQAFNAVLVEPNAKLRLGSADQVGLSNIYLDQGILDLNGNSIEIDSNGELTGLRDAYIDGSIINENPNNESTLHYSLDGLRNITGNLGSSAGALNFVYQPSTANSNFTVDGNAILNVVDVKSGSVTYSANSQNRVNDLKLAESTSLNLLSGSNSTISASNLAKNSQINVAANIGATTELAINSTGAGRFNKSGEGLLKLSGNLSHTGATNFSGGQVELNGNLANSPLVLETDTTLGGNATIGGSSIFRNGSHIQPGLNQDNANFAGSIMKFANVINEGADVLLRVKNENNQIQSWEHDQLLISGNLQSERTIPVDVQFLGTGQDNSDKNKNGKYDPDEGISLIQVLGEGKVSQFALGKKLDASKQQTDLYQYTLVSVDKPVSVSTENRSGQSGKFFDYRLQTLLVDESGNSPEPVIRSVSKKGTGVTTDDKQPLGTTEYIDLILAEKAKSDQERDTALADKANAEKAVQDALANKANAEKVAQDALADKANAEKVAQSALVDKANAEKAVQDALANKANAEKVAQDALADKARAEKAAQDALSTLASDKANAEKFVQDALADKANAEKVAQDALANKANAEKAAQDALANKERAEKAAQDALANKANAEKAAQDALADKANAEKAAQNALADKANAEKAAQDALADKANAEKAAQNALADKANAEKAAQDALADKVNAEKAAQDALADKANAEKAAQDALADKANAEKVAQDLLEEKQRKHRVALNQKAPSILIANTAIFHQGDNVRRQFMDNMWSQDKKGFYVSQQDGNSKYTSDLGFMEYGYNYKAKQSSTLFGGFVPVSENTELHTAIGFNTQTVTPNAADGASETKYKSTSFLAGLHQKWDQVILNTSLGYHLHKGKISTPQETDTAKIEAKQLQVTGEAGYDIPVGNLNLIPVLGLSYQQVKSKFKDPANKWNVDFGNYNVFSQYAGLNVVWKNDLVRLTAGSFFENNEANTKSVTIQTGQQKANFQTGNVGNALLFKLNSEIALTKQLGLGIRLEHRHGLSDAKLKQTQVGAKLEYKF